MSSLLNLKEQRYIGKWRFLQFFLILNMASSTIREREEKLYLLEDIFISFLYE